MKNKFALILIFLLVISLSGCAKQPDGEIAGPEDLDIPAPGYWRLEPAPEAEGARQAYPGEDALQELADPCGVLAFLGISEDGEHLAFLCRLEKNSGKNPVLAAVLVVREEEGFRLADVRELDLSSYAGPGASSDAGLAFAPGWEYSGENPPLKWDAVVAAIWNRLNANLIGTSYRPIALLGTHEEEGKSWAVLCDGNAGVNGPLGMFVATMDRDAEGKVSFGAITRLDIGTIFDGAD